MLSRTLAKMLSGLLMTNGSVGPADHDTVSLGEIEGGLRALGSTAQEGVEEATSSIVGAVAAAAGLVVAGAYLLGRRHGRRRATVLEIHKV